MRLADVLAAADLAEPLSPEAARAEVAALAYDSRAVGPGTLFFCVPGFRSDGHDHAAAAVAAGAGALVVERPLGLGVPEARVPSARAAMAAAAAAFHGDPTARLQVVGITGTNGKTTSAWLVRAILEHAGIRCGLLGTVLSVVGGEERPVQRTTPEAIDLQRTFAEMAAAGDRACAMEVSSHALELHRADAIHFAAAAFTNLTQDHLDFHPDMDAYFAAKSRLFTELDPGTAVVNVDDPWGAKLAARLDAPVTVAIDAPASLRAEDLEPGPAGSRFVAAGGGARTPVELRLPGRFNVLNALGAIAAAEAVGVAREQAAAALATVERVPGRFEAVDAGQDFAVIVDYAHTPDSLENVLVAARDLAAGGRVIAVFGAGGDRDRGKRPLMGEIAARLADVAIVTSDNPRSEDPEAIIGEIMAGAGGRAEPIEDRRAAIAAAVGRARTGDVVVIAGKGHEQGQELAGGVKVPFDDAAVALEALRG